MCHTGALSAAGRYPSARGLECDRSRGQSPAHACDMSDEPCSRFNFWSALSNSDGSTDGDLAGLLGKPLNEASGQGEVAVDPDIRHPGSTLAVEPSGHRQIGLSLLTFAGSAKRRGISIRGRRPIAEDEGSNTIAGRFEPGWQHSGKRSRIGARSMPTAAPEKCHGGGGTSEVVPPGDRGKLHPLIVIVFSQMSDASVGADAASSRTGVGFSKPRQFAVSEIRWLGIADRHQLTSRSSAS